MFRILVIRTHGGFLCISKSILYIFKSVGYSFVYNKKIKGTNDTKLYLTSLLFQTKPTKVTMFITPRSIHV